MKAFLLSILLAPEVWGAVTLVIGALVYLFVKGNTKQKVRGVIAIAKQVFDIVEKTIPDDTENKTAKKIDLAAEKFVEIYNDTFGKNPDFTLIQLAQIVWKDLAADTKLGKSIG